MHITVNLIGQYLLSEIHEVSSPASHGASSPFSSRDSVSRYRFTNHMIYAIKGRLSMTLTRYVHMLSLLPRTYYHNQGWGMRDRDFQQYTILFPKPYLTIHMNLYTYFDTLVSYETKCYIAPECLCNQPTYNRLWDIVIPEVSNSSNQLLTDSRLASTVST